MQRKLIAPLVILFMLADTTAQAQELAPEKNTAKGRKDFVQFDIPSLLNGSNIDPSPTTNLAIDLGDERVTLKTGFQLTRKGDNAYKWTFVIAPYAQASDGVSTVFSKGEGISDYGTSLGLNWVFKRTSYRATQVGADNLNKLLDPMEKRQQKFAPAGEDAPTIKRVAKDDMVSMRVQWLALRSTLDRSTYTLFDTTATFAELQQDRELGLGQVFLSYNYFFQSALPKYRLGNLIASVGLGYASMTNYKQLEERVLQEGSLVYNSDSSAYRTIAETTDGRAGQLIVTPGMAAYVEAYKTVVQLRNEGAIRLGVRYTNYAPGSVNENSILSGGLFFTTKKKPDADGKAEDAANFSLTLRLDQFQKNGDAGYFDQYAKVLVGAAVPLRFR